MRKLALLILLASAVVGCSSGHSYLNDPKREVAKCAENWRSQGHNFDPNRMTCWEMFQTVSAIRRAAYWQERGYSFDPNSMTWEEMDRKVRDVDRAAYWREEGYDLDPNTMTASQMDAHVAELEKVEYWREAGYYYDPNSETVFLSEAKKTKLSSVVVSSTPGRYTYSYSPSYRASSYRSRYSSVPTYGLRGIAENSSYYGQISDNTGRAKTVYVRGYFRRDGTYVRSHYRSPPRR